jgi:hypothetical protein
MASRRLVQQPAEHRLLRSHHRPWSALIEQAFLNRAGLVLLLVAGALLGLIHLLAWIHLILALLTS